MSEANRLKTLRLSPRMRQERNAGYTLVVPALIVIGAVTLFPIAYSVWMSLNHVSLTTNGYQLTFRGLHNYQVLVHSSVFWHSAWFTFFYAVVTVMVELVLGMCIAVAIHNVSSLKNVSIVVMLIPWSLITVISAQMWRYIYNGVYGVLNFLLIQLHFVSSPVTWLGSSGTAVIAMMVADIWKTTPFVVIILLAGLQMISSEYYEAARMDGANSWQVFWRLTFPLLRGSIALAAIFRVLQAFGVFDLPYVLTSGGPGDSTTSLALLGEQVLFQNLQFGIGSAVAVATVLIVLVVSIVFISAFRAMVEGESA